MELRGEGKNLIAPLRRVGILSIFVTSFTEAVPLVWLFGVAVYHKNSPWLSASDGA